ncbi:MAG: DUF362 domain-containing protein [bacterium]|nr:DUF362 domain-containing protein [bacterium]
MKKITRRKFLKLAGIGTAGLVAKPILSFGTKGNKASDVVQCYSADTNTGSTINQSTVQLMMNASIKALTGQSTVGDAWKSIFPGINSSSVIGIKVNCINSALSTHPTVVNCIVNGLIQMNLGGTNFIKNNVIIWDRTNGELTSAGYTRYTGTDANTVRCFGTNQSGVGSDSSVSFNVYGSTQHPSKILSQMCDYIINAAVLKDHSFATTTLCMKNNFGSTDTISHDPDGHCGHGIPALNQQIRDVLVPNNIQKIFIIDAIFGVVNWGPGGSPNCNPKKIIMSFDPVACDTQGQNIINEERTKLGYSTISADSITNAAQAPYNLGTTSVNLIQVTNIGIEEAQLLPAKNDIFTVSPNPLRKSANIKLNLRSPSFIHLDIYNSSGKFETSLYHGYLNEGIHKINCNLNKNLPSGTYFLSLYTQEKMFTQKISILH